MPYNLEKLQNFLVAEVLNVLIEQDLKYLKGLFILYFDEDPFVLNYFLANRQKQGTVSLIEEERVFRIIAFVVRVYVYDKSGEVVKQL